MMAYSELGYIQENHAQFSVAEKVYIKELLKECETSFTVNDVKK